MSMPFLFVSPSRLKFLNCPLKDLVLYDVFLTIEQGSVRIRMTIGSAVGSLEGFLLSLLCLCVHTYTDFPLSTKQHSLVF
jgi:hypothetical protein